MNLPSPLPKSLQRMTKRMRFAPDGTVASEYARVHTSFVVPHQMFDWAVAVEIHVDPL